MRDVKPLKYKDLPGLSEKQLSEHHDVLYAGYVKKLNEIEEKLQTVDRSAPNATYSDIRELKLEQTFAANGVKLHEYYFENMTPAPNPPAGKIKELIERDFGSYEKWLEDFKASGMASRGWVVLAYDLDDGKLYNYLCDVHNQGGVWNAMALLVLDVYEHAYFIDYATKRKDYVEAFLKTIDWGEVNGRLDKFKIL
ncbi:superoxide dismutase [Candidatus Azambacteria bacterium]|nr:superoxide dismutase [Candidatus Azambacteria bacterium]